MGSVESIELVEKSVLYSSRSPSCDSVGQARLILARQCSLDFGGWGALDMQVGTTTIKYSISGYRVEL